jgi:hypothetical protein
VRRRIKEHDFTIYIVGSKWIPMSVRERTPLSYEVLDNDRRASRIKVKTRSRAGNWRESWVSYSSWFDLNLVPLRPPAPVPVPMPMPMPSGSDAPAHRRQLHTDVSDALWHALDAYVTKTEKSKASIVAEALAWYLAYHAARAPKAAE